MSTPMKAKRLYQEGFNEKRGLRGVYLVRIRRHEETLLCYSDYQNKRKNEVTILEGYLVLFFEEILHNTGTKPKDNWVRRPSQVASRMIAQVMMD